MAKRNGRAAYFNMNNYSDFKVYPVKWAQFSNKEKRSFLQECVSPKDGEGMPVLTNGYPYWKEKPFSRIGSQDEMRRCNKWYHDGLRFSSPKH